MYNTKRHIQTYQKLFDKTIKGDSNHMTKEKIDTTANKEIKPEYIKAKSKRFDAIPQAKIYLGTPYFNDKQKERVEKATKALQKNPTVAVVHFPFDTQFGDATVDNQKDGVFGSRLWQDATLKNDLNAMGTCTAGVFLYDLDNEDSGCAFEEGFLNAQGKPVINILFAEKEASKKLNLMIAGGTTAYLGSIKELETYNFNHTPANPETPYEVY